MTSTPTTTEQPTAREVVAAYLQEKAESTRPTELREHVAAVTREIVDELPDGFTYKDVRACVGKLVDGQPELEGLTPQRIGRVVTKTLDDMVAGGRLASELGGAYVHRGA